MITDIFQPVVCIFPALHISKLRLVLTSDGVGAGVGVIRELMT